MHIDLTKVNSSQNNENEINTSKYNIYSFLPLNLFHQFSKVANLYFLILTLLQMVKPISITNGIPTIALSLAFVISVSMLKDFIEEIKSWKSDKEENESKSTAYQMGQYE